MSIQVGGGRDGGRDEREGWRCSYRLKEGREREGGIEGRECPYI